VSSISWQWNSIGHHRQTSEPSMTWLKIVEIHNKPYEEGIAAHMMTEIHAIHSFKNQQYQ
jgi:hypothetical protein